MRLVMWGVIACLASPCCAPLLVPLALTLIAGTPVALWLTSMLGWIYGALTLVCLLSLFFVFRSFESSRRSPHPLTARESELVQSSQIHRP